MSFLIKVLVSLFSFIKFSSLWISECLISYFHKYRTKTSLLKMMVWMKINPMVLKIRLSRPRPIKTMKKLSFMTKMGQKIRNLKNRWAFSTHWKFQGWWSTLCLILQWNLLITPSFSGCPIICTTDSRYLPSNLEIRNPKVTCFNP